MDFAAEAVATLPLPPDLAAEAIGAIVVFLSQTSVEFFMSRNVKSVATFLKPFSLCKVMIKLDLSPE